MVTFGAIRELHSIPTSRVTIRVPCRCWTWSSGCKCTFVPLAIYSRQKIRDDPSQAIPPTSTSLPSTSIAMILTVLIPALAFIGQIHAAPLSAHNISSLANALSDSPACNDIHKCRTQWSIIYSCLATIFACTWVSFHPDIPDRTHTQWRIRVTRVLSVFVSFLVPELTVAKAASEYWKVREYKFPFHGAC